MITVGKNTAHLTTNIINKRVVNYCTREQNYPKYTCCPYKYDQQC